MAKLKIHHTNGTANIDAYVSPITINGTHIGGTGGNIDQTSATIRVSYLRETTSAVDTGYIVTQKGRKQFQVTNSAGANASIVTLVNAQSAELSTANTAAILVNVAVIAGANVGNIGAGEQTSAYITFAAANVTGYSTPVVGYQIAGTSMSGNVTISEINSTGNVTVTVDTQDIADEQVDITEGFNAARISNKYVHDWAGTKWRYFLTTPYGDGTAQTGGPAWAANTLVQVDSQ